MRILQINTSVNSGSTGRIAEEIGQLLIGKGYKSYIAYGRTNNSSKSEVIKIGEKKDLFFHLLKTRLTDRHGFGSKKATEGLITKIEEINPDAIGLHNIHGYYINIEVLFNFLKDFNKPVVWTLHDCWAFTGHCAHFERVNCYKWLTECNKCPLTHYYPASIMDNSKKNFIVKRSLFNRLNSLNIVTPSKWLSEYVKKSFLSSNPVSVIHNGINLEIFKPSEPLALKRKYNLIGKKIILGVTNIWAARKGLDDFIVLSKTLNHDYKIFLVGLTKAQLKKLPDNIIGVTRTANQNELADIYSLADVFVNPTYIDNFPTTNLEALACGTPVITYNTGGSPEAVDENTGIVVEKGNINQLLNAIKEVTDKGKEHYSFYCRQRAEKYFDKNSRYNDYLKLYSELIG